MVNEFEEKNEIGYKCGVMFRFKYVDVKIIQRVNWYLFTIDGIYPDITEPQMKKVMFMNYAEISNLLKTLETFLHTFDTGDLNDLVNDLFKRIKNVTELRNVENALLASK